MKMDTMYLKTSDIYQVKDDTFPQVNINFRKNIR